MVDLRHLPEVLLTLLLRRGLTRTLLLKALNSMHLKVVVDNIIRPM